MAIQSFGDTLTEMIWLGERDKEVAKFPQDLLPIAERKLDILNSAEQLRDLAALPGNRLEKLSGNLEQYWSIRINKRWKLIFKWRKDGPELVQIVDYH